MEYRPHRPLNVVLYIRNTKETEIHFQKHMTHTMHIPWHLQNGIIELRLYESRPGYIKIGNVSFMPDIARGESGFSQSQNRHAHSASPAEVRMFFEASTVTVGDVLKRINEFSVNRGQSCEVSEEYANSAGWVFLIINSSKSQDTYKIVDHDFPFLDIPSRFFVSSDYDIAIVTNPVMVSNTPQVLPGKISMSDTSYFGENM